jgi:hypothetical protein
MDLFQVPDLSGSRPFDQVPFRGAFHVDGNAEYQDLAQVRRAESINLKAGAGFVLPKTKPVHEIL